MKTEENDTELGRVGHEEKEGQEALNQRHTDAGLNP